MCSLILLYFSILFFPFDLIYSLNISGICGFPGEPISSDNNLQNKEFFKSGDIVNYQCIDFMTTKMERTCIEGQWVGPQARCVYGIDNDLKRVVVMDCKDDKVFADYNQIRLQNNNNHFVNSFSTERYKEEPIRAVNGTCLRWHLHLTNRSNFQFVRIDFATVFEGPSKSTQEVPSITSFIPKQNSVLFKKFESNKCKNEDMKRYKHIYTNKWITYGHKYHYYISCQTNSNKIESQTVFVIQTSTQTPITIDFVRFAIGEVYGGTADPGCGLPEIPVGLEAIPKIGYQSFEIFCETDFVNTTSVWRTQLNCTSDGFWSGSYPKCKPRKSCADTNSFKINQKILIQSIENVFYYNKSFWYAINGSVLNYRCEGQASDSLDIKSIKCLKTGFWDNQLICEKPLAPTTRQSMGELLFAKHLLPIYAIVSFTSLIVIFIAIAGFCYIRKSSERKEYKDPNDTNCAQNDDKEKHNEVSGWIDRQTTDRPLTESTYVDDMYTFRSKYRQPSEAIYDVPPSRAKALSFRYDDKQLYQNLMSEVLYDSPKRKDPKPN